MHQLILKDSTSKMIFYHLIIIYCDRRCIRTLIQFILSSLERIYRRFSKNKPESVRSTHISLLFEKSSDWEIEIDSIEKIYYGYDFAKWIWFAGFLNIIINMKISGIAFADLILKPMHLCAYGMWNLNL